MTKDSYGISIGFAAGFLLPFALAIAFPAHSRPLSRAERIAYRVCGPDGTVDWDPNRRYPPPHCNRNGWNGKRYVEPKRRRK